MFCRQTQVLTWNIINGFLSSLSELSLQLLNLTFCFLKLTLKLIIFFIMIVLDLAILYFFDFRRKFPFTILCFQFHNFLVVVGLALSIKFGQSFHPFILIFNPLEILLLFFSLLLLMLSLALSQLLLGFEFIFYCLTYQCICGCSLNILYIQASKILFLSCWRVDQLFIDDSFFSNGWIVTHPLEMFFICRLEVLISLRYLDHKGWLFSIFESAIR